MPSSSAALTVILALALGRPPTPCEVRVAYCQEVFREWRCDPSLPIDGRIGSRTELCLRRLQRFAHLPETGELDEGTLAALIHVITG